MAIADVVTMGFGSFSSANKIPTLGYTPASVGGAMCLKAIDAYVAGAVAKDAYVAGAANKDAYVAGAVTGGTC